ncbi:MAG: hypothetical protein GY701_22895 [Sulfitobacter sp.]|nr:hypothetical protein [Sulfitobacter sp.]
MTTTITTNDDHEGHDWEVTERLEDNPAEWAEHAVCWDCGVAFVYKDSAIVDEEEEAYYQDLVNEQDAVEDDRDWIRRQLASAHGEMADACTAAYKVQLWEKIGSLELELAATYPDLDDDECPF